MNIIICGAGRVGFTIAKLLTEQNHSITVIDQSSEDIQKINESLDVKAIVGKATSPEILDRANTAVVDAYLLPLLHEYVGSLKRALGRTSFSIMQSHGGLTDAENFQGRNSILSGPAGGVIGAVKTAKYRGFSRIICFDMGGTSTDVAHYNDNYEYRSQSKIESIAINSNSMDISTVAAGGGSIVKFDGIRYKVGPESGGSYPGPACYGNGGPATVTDCNVLLGIIRPEFFPALFGKEKNLKANGLLATCIQHEIDHLNGILFIDYLSKLKKDMIIKKLIKHKKDLEKVIL